jgi:putative addiction module component (TIGR02574 family)
MMECEANMTTKLTPELARLPVGEKLRLVAELWDSIGEDGPFNISGEQWAEIRRRMQATDSDPESLVTEQEMRRRLGWTA